MKTALKQLIERIEKQMSAIPNDPNLTERALYDSYLNCKNWATELLDKEKEQIIDFHVMLMKNGLEQEGNAIEWNYNELKEEASKFYKQTYD